MAVGWRITRPILSEENRVKAAQAGGLTGGAEPGGFARAVLLGLQHKPVYQGTVDPAVVAGRRAKNRAARRARRINRLAVKR